MSETTPEESLHFLDYWRVIRSRKEIVISVFLLVVMTGVILTSLMPKVYMASVVIQVKEELPDVTVFRNEGGRFDPYFLRTQFEIIQSVPILEEVIHKRNLGKTLSVAYGYDALPPDKIASRTFKIVSKSMRVQQYRDTNLIEIQMYMSEPKGRANSEVAAAANMIADVYRDQSMRRSRTASDAALRSMEQSLAERNRIVTQAAQKVEDVRQKYKLNVLSSTARSDSSIDKMGLARQEDQRLRVMLELEEKKVRYQTVMSLQEDELLNAAQNPQSVLGDAVLSSLMQARRQAEVELRTLQSAAYGAQHPDVIKQQTLLNELNAKIQDAIKGFKTGVRVEFEAAQAKSLALQAMIDDTKNKERLSESSGYREFDKVVEEWEHAKKIRDALEIRYLQERIEQNVPRTTIEVIERAEMPDEGDPVSPDFTLNLLLSVLLGLVAGVGLAYFMEYVDTSIKTVEEVERFMKVSVLGVIPQKVKAFVDRTADTAHAEAYRMLRTNLQFSEKFKGGKTICVTSGSVAEGKSLTAFNLSYVCAQLGDRVLLVDADLHRPRQHKILGVSNKNGLANVLIGDSRFSDVVLATAQENLSFVPSGRLAGNVHGVLDNRRLKELIGELKQQYDLIVFDAPPVIGVSDASFLVREMDGVIQVIQHRKYPRSVSSRAKDMIENVGGRLLGVVLNNINISRDYSYYYQYHYYYYPRRDGETGQRGKKTDAGEKS